ASEDYALLLRALFAGQHSEDRNTSIDQPWDGHCCCFRKGANFKTCFWKSNYLEAGSLTFDATFSMDQPGRQNNQLSGLRSDTTVPELVASSPFRKGDQLPA